MMKKQMTCWDIADDLQLIDPKLKEEWLDLLDYNYDPLNDTGGYPWFGKGKETLLEEANNWFKENRISMRAEEVGKDEECYVWEIEDFS